MQQTGRISNLDGLRFLAAAVVAICHFDIIKAFFGFERTGWHFYNNAAQMAVSFFFVLSGFLITFLLLKEKYANPDHRFRLFRFYGKRIRRIWPLYYLMLLVSFFVLPQYHLLPHYPEPANELLMKRMAGYLVWLPNYTEYNFGPQPFMGQTWSLAVEEFFYLFFPIGLYYVKQKNVLRYLFLLTIISLILTIVVQFLIRNSSFSVDSKSVLFIITDKYRIYAFGAGGLVAWILLHTNQLKGKWMLIVKQKKTAIFLSLMLTGMVLIGITFSGFTQLIYAFLFALLILSLESSGTRYSLLNHRILLYLGKISYGIYMLHPLAILLCFRVGAKLFPVGIAGEIFLAIASMLLTVLLSALSYELMEKQFLKRKENS